MTANAAGQDSHAQQKAAKRERWALHALFSDESDAFRTPCFPRIGERVTVRLRVEAGLDARPCVLVGDSPSRVAMTKTKTDDLFDWYEAEITCGIEPLTYRFSAQFEGRDIIYRRDGSHWADETAQDACDFRIVPDESIPTWAQGAIQYQIFPDRFANGEPANDVVDCEYAYDESPVRKIASWDEPPANDDYRCFYGGDFQGVASKLDYLQSLGVEAIYFNPIFISPSSHKYDTQDYEHVDPHFGVICDDINRPLAPWDSDNRNALQYVRRTTSAANLKASDDLFAQLCQEMHRRGMKVILDGVFNHCGSFNAWMDREHIYNQGERGTHGASKKLGAYHAMHSPYRSYFRFTGNSTVDYDAWWNFPSLPKLNYENSTELCDRIIGIAQHWAMPPYSIDGWRLDVAADLGQTESFNHEFWHRFRREVKRVNPNLVIVAEHYGDPSSWLQGDQWDTVMNYDAFMDPLTYFLTGMEKHSDAKNDDLYQNGEAFCHTMRQNMARFSWGSLLCAMNELSNHDHSRFLTRTNRCVGRTESAGAHAAGVGIDKRVMREAVVVQMTWPGAPTIYYGDEAGQVGWTDPDCRRTYPWGAEDEGLIELHRTLAALRKSNEALRTGSFALLGGGYGWFAFGRFRGDNRLVILCNNADEKQNVRVRVRDVGIEDGCALTVCLRTTKTGFKTPNSKVDGTVVDGFLSITIPSRRAVILSA